MNNHYIASRNLLLSAYLGLPGYPAPRFEQLSRVFASDEGAKLRDQYGITVTGSLEHNELWIAPGARPYDLRIGFGEKVGNCVVIEPCAYLSGSINATQAEAGTILIGGGEYVRLDIVLDGRRPALYLGAGSYFGGIDCWVQGYDHALIVGEDCITGWDVNLRTGDFHGVFDLSSGEMLNLPRSVVVGPHVWLAHDVMVCKGVEIGAGSIVGAGAVVTRNLPGQCSAAGVPAVVLRTGVSWTRQAFPAADVRQALRERPYMRRLLNDLPDPHSIR